MFGANWSFVGVFKGSVFRDAVFFSKGSVFGLLKQLLILKEC